MVKNDGACPLFRVKFNHFVPHLSILLLYQYLTFVDAIIEIYEMKIHRCLPHRWHPYGLVKTIKYFSNQQVQMIKNSKMKKTPIKWTSTFVIC